MRRVKTNEEHNKKEVRRWTELGAWPGVTYEFRRHYQSYRRYRSWLGVTTVTHGRCVLSPSTFIHRTLFTRYAFLCHLNVALSCMYKRTGGQVNLGCGICLPSCSSSILSLSLSLKRNAQLNLLKHIWRQHRLLISKNYPKQHLTLSFRNYLKKHLTLYLEHISEENTQLSYMSLATYSTVPLRSYQYLLRKTAELTPSVRVISRTPWPPGLELCYTPRNTALELWSTHPHDLNLF